MLLAHIAKVEFREIGGKHGGMDGKTGQKQETAHEGDTAALQNDLRMNRGRPVVNRLSMPARAAA